MFGLSNIQFSFGLDSSRFELSNVTILVGPNNSGKSTVLRNIEEWLNSISNSRSGLLKNIGISLSDDDCEFSKFEKDLLEFEDGDRIIEDGKELIPLSKTRMFDSGTYDQGRYDFKDIRREFDNKNIQYFKKHFFKYFIVRLAGQTRFDLTNDEFYGLVFTSKRPINRLSRLLENKETQNKIGNIVFENFKWYPFLGEYKEKTGTKIQIRASRIPLLKNKIPT